MKNLFIFLVLILATLFVDAQRVTFRGVGKKIKVNPVKIWYNAQQSYTATCPAGTTGSDVNVVVAAGTYLSYISQADADNLAYEAAKQSAGSSLSCSPTPTIYTNTEQSYTATCPSGTTGSDVTVTKTAGTYSSTISQADANNQALAAATSEANAALVCTQIPVTYYNIIQSYTASCSSGYTGDPVTIVVAPGTFSSTISQGYVDSVALDSATRTANTQLVCLPITPTVGLLDTLPTITSSNPGGITAPGDAFSFNTTMVAASNTPQIAEWTRSGGTNEHISLTGYNLSASYQFKVYDGQSLYDAPFGADTAGANVIDTEKGSFRLPNVTWRAFLVWAKNANGWGKPIRVNCADIFWVDDSVAAGMTARVYGRNLAHNNVDGVNNSYLYIRSVSTGQWYYPNVTKVTPYAVEYTVPSLPAGPYEMYAHNGHGGDYFFSGKKAFYVVGTARNVVTKTWGSTYNAATLGVNAAISAAAGSGGTVYFPAGTYNVSAAMTLYDNVQWLGDVDGSGNPTSIINLTASFVNSGEGFWNHDGSPYMVKMKNLKFVGNGYSTDNVTTVGSDRYSSFATMSGKMMLFENVVIDWRTWETLYFKGGSSNIYIKNSRLIGGSWEFGCVMNAENSKQVHISGTTFEGTNDCTGAVINKGMIETSFIGNTIKDLDNSVAQKSTWMKGRIWSSTGAGGAQYNCYFAENIGTGLGVRTSGSNIPDPNSGEIFLWEANAALYRGAVTSATSSTFTIGTTIPDTIGADPTAKRMAVAITAGKGVGQFRVITSGAGTTTGTINRPWEVIPDNTSIVVTGPFVQDIVMYRNALDANGKSYIASNPNNQHNASTGTNLYGGCFGIVFSRNTCTGTRAGVTQFAMQHSSDKLDPNYFNLFEYNKFNGNRFPIQLNTEGSSGMTYPCTAIIGTTFRNDTVTNIVSMSLSGTPYRPEIAYYLRYTTTYPLAFPLTTLTTWEKCIIYQTPRFNWWGTSDGTNGVYPYPRVLVSGMVNKEIFYNNN